MEVTYNVLVNNLGMVVSEETDYEKAYRDYLDYVEISKTGTTQRAYGETVTLLSSEQDEPLEEYEGQLDRDNADCEIADDDSLDVENRLAAINRLLESPLTLPEDCSQLLELYKTLDTPEE